MIEPLTLPEPHTIGVGYPFGGDWSIEAAELEFGLTLDEIAGRLRGARQLAFLDSTRRDVDSGRYSYLTADPFQVLRSWGWRVELAGQHDHCLLYGDAWTFLGDLLRRVRIETVPGLPPFQTGVVGYFGYDLGRLLERLPASANDDLGLPDMQLGFYDWTLAADHETGRSWLIVAGPAADLAQRFKSRLEWLSQAINLSTPPAAVPNSSSVVFRSNYDRNEYICAAQRAREYILAGDIYQVCLSQRLTASYEGDGWALYSALRCLAPVPHGAYLRLGDLEVLSASPERFLQLQGRQIETRPIKGTIRRGTGDREDREFARQLAASEKDRAENVMIVDLLRNDIGRVCEIGTVKVPRINSLEAHPNVWHLVSTISGELAPDKDAIDLLKACFPGGSVTGCPKIRAMEIIEELEPVRRGIYCGAIGYLGFNGDMDTGIVIRTLIKSANKLHLQVGGAVMADSDPEGEYAETLVKAGSVAQALGAVIDER